jgi:SPP1 family predicted phage head-tail adaptor
MLSSGDLRHHQITIQAPVLTKDSNGADIQDWEDVYENVNAKVVPLSVGQFIAASASQSKILGRLIIRSRPGLAANQRVLHRGQIYDIGEWLPDPESGHEFVTAPYSTHVNRGGF